MTYKDQNEWSLSARESQNVVKGKLIQETQQRLKLERQQNDQLLEALRTLKREHAEERVCVCVVCVCVCVSPCVCVCAWCQIVVFM